MIDSTWGVSRKKAMGVMRGHGDKTSKCLKLTWDCDSQAFFVKNYCMN